MPQKVLAVVRRLMPGGLENVSIMAKHIGAEHFVHKIQYKDAPKVIDRIMKNMDEPYSDSSAIQSYLVSQLAARSVKVVLTGDAGDGHCMFLRSGWK